MSETKVSYALKHVQSVEADISGMKTRVEQLDRMRREVKEEIAQARALLQFLKQGTPSNGDAEHDEPPSFAGLASAETLEIVKQGTAKKAADRQSRRHAKPRKVVTIDDYKAAVDRMDGKFSKHDLAATVGSTPDAAQMALKKLLKAGYVSEQPNAIPRQGKVPPSSLWRKL